jgi:DNA-binding NarL/FixJ family response regulator
MREAIRCILAPDCELVAWAEDGHEVIGAALEMRPDTILLDISLPGISGMSLLPLLRDALPATTIVMLTNHTSEHYVEEAYRRGADAYVIKSEAHEALLPAIRRGRITHPAVASAQGVAGSAS